MQHRRLTHRLTGLALRYVLTLTQATKWLTTEDSAPLFNPIHSRRRRVSGRRLVILVCFTGLQLGTKYIPIQDWRRRETTLHHNGYVLIRVPEHPKSFSLPFRGCGWYYEHRLVVERRIGRVLQSWETVHHISENRQDNSDDNLFCCTRDEHDYAV